MASLHTQVFSVPELGWPWTNFEAPSTLAAAKTATATAPHLPQQDEKTCQEGQGHEEHPQIPSTLVKVPYRTLFKVPKSRTMVQTAAQTKKKVKAVGAKTASFSANDVTREKRHQSQEGRGQKHASGDFRITLESRNFPS